MSCHFFAGCKSTTSVCYVIKICTTNPALCLILFLARTIINMFDCHIMVFIKLQTCGKKLSKIILLICKLKRSIRSPNQLQQCLKEDPSRMIPAERLVVMKSLTFSYRSRECGGGCYICMECTILKTVWLILLEDVFLTEKQIGGIKL